MRISIILEARCIGKTLSLLRSQSLKECVKYPQDVVGQVNILEHQWICKTTLLLRNGNLKGGILETSKTEGEIFTKNVIDRLRYWDPTYMMKKSMPHGI